MRKSMPITVIVGIAAAWGVGGCDAVSHVVLPTTVTATFTNTSAEFDVEIDVFYSDQQDMPDFLLRELGENITRTIPPGASVTIERDCDEFQAIMIDDADLIVVGGIGPEDSTDVMRDGDDFACGDTLAFTFTHTDAVVDFEILTSAE